MSRFIGWALVFIVVAVTLPPPSVSAEPIATSDFERTWARTDAPVAGGQVVRTWMWGPEPFTQGFQEEYGDAPGGLRNVQYFDKSRMEDNSYRDSAPWDVTNGLLATELMSGQMQMGDGEFVSRSPAEVNVAGDADDADGPTYAAFGQVMDADPMQSGSILVNTIDRNGNVGTDQSLSSHSVTAGYYVPETNHTVASVFWEFMNSSGKVREGGALTDAKLFENPFYATGFPTTEAYWAKVRVAGTPRWVLTQAFQRRVMTYTPDNAKEWRVEAGNVGQHYYQWRYGAMAIDPGPSDLANALAEQVKKAPNNSARYDALLKVMDHLNIGVYTGAGTQILKGGERDEGDFYLYDIELQMMSAALGRGDTWSFEDTAMFLNELSLFEDDMELDAQLLLNAAREGSMSAKATPNDRMSLVPLLLRQLGLYQSTPYDLFSAPDLETTRLDALGYFLMIAELTLPGVEELGPAEIGSSQLLSMSEGVLTQASTGPCDTVIGDIARETFPFGKHIGAKAIKAISEKAKIVAKVGKYAPTTAAVLDGIHGAILAYSVQVKALDTTSTQHLVTHYGPQGHAPHAGKELQFRIEVRMLDKLPDTLIHCGWILGLDFPDQGPIEGVTMVWRTGKLKEHGAIICDRPTCEKTAPGTGVATLIFRPKDEKNPGVGWEVEERGIVTASALYGLKFKNIFSITSHLLTPKSDSIAYAVRYHETPGWEARMVLKYNVKVDDGLGDVSWAKGEVVYQLKIPLEDLHNHNGVMGSFVATGSGSYGYPRSPVPVTCSWNGNWARQAPVQLISKDPKIVKPTPYTLMWHFGSGETSHPTTPSDLCHSSTDRGQNVMIQVPSFSLDETKKQVKEVSAPGTMSGMTGSIVWEITVVPSTGL